MMATAEEGLQKAAAEPADPSGYWPPSPVPTSAAAGICPHERERDDSPGDNKRSSSRRLLQFKQEGLNWHPSRPSVWSPKHIWPMTKTTRRETNKNPKTRQHRRRFAPQHRQLHPERVLRPPPPVDYHNINIWSIMKGFTYGKVKVSGKRFSKCLSSCGARLFCILLRSSPP